MRRSPPWLVGMVVGAAARRVARQARRGWPRIEIVFVSVDDSDAEVAEFRAR